MDSAAELLAGTAVEVAGLYRTHPAHNLAAVHAAIVAAFAGREPVALGRAGRLAVIAVDGLGFHPAASTLSPDLIRPLTSEFPTTTMACMLTSLTGVHAGTHGYVGVQYLDDDGLGTVNCHSGGRDEPTTAAPARPTVTPTFATVFDEATRAGAGTVAVPNELAHLHAGIRDRLLRGCATLLAPMPPPADPRGAVAALADQLTAALAATAGPALVWSYLDLDTPLHRTGVDRSIVDACADLDRLARRLASEGTAVLVFSDHGLTANRASAPTEALWREVSSPAWCRLPGGGAGRIRWLYPHAGRAQELADLLAGAMADAVVRTPEAVASAGFLAPGSIGVRRLGEVVLIATGGDFPTPGPAVAYEHGSMTADEVLVPLAIWQPDH